MKNKMNKMKKSALLLGIGLITFGMETPAMAISSPSFDLDLSVDTKSNAVDLSWGVPDYQEPYLYQLYQKKEGSNEFQTASTTDLKKEVKVLNIYPQVDEKITFKTWKGETKTKPKSASVEMWMESPNAENNKGYGMGLIDVDSVEEETFNKNPNNYLKDKNGNYKYDVVFNGAWDANGNDVDYSAEGVKSIMNFINTGRGYLMGHDTLKKNMPNNLKLSDLVNIKIFDQVNFTSKTNSLGNTKVKLNKKGLLTTHPWKISEKMDIPLSHSWRQFAYGDVWFEYDDIENPPKDYWFDHAISDPNGKGTNNFYLTTWNNTAMIQTGHSKGEATTDEQKILANTFFYLSQLTNDTETKDRSAMDLKAPDAINFVNYDVNSNKVDFLEPKDNGTIYEYYVEAIGQNSGKRKSSKSVLTKNTSGIAGYSYVVDNKPNTIPNGKINASTNEIKLNSITDTGNWFHIVAVDKAGNVSKVYHQELDRTLPNLEIESENPEWTNKNVVLKATGSSSIKRIILPNGTIVNGNKAIFEATDNGVYTFAGLNEDGVISEIGSYVVNNIDRKAKTGVIMPDDEKWRNQDIEVTIKIK